MTQNRQNRTETETGKDTRYMAVGEIDIFRIISELEVGNSARRMLIAAAGEARILFIKLLRQQPVTELEVRAVLQSLEHAMVIAANPETAAKQARDSRKAQKLNGRHRP